MHEAEAGADKTLAATALGAKIGNLFSPGIGTAIGGLIGKYFKVFHMF